MASQIDAAFNYNDLKGLNNIKSMARKDDPEAMKVVAQQFESMFINMVLKSMRQATDVMSSDMLSSNETKFYRDMHDQQLSLSLSKTGGYGLADVLYEQLMADMPQRASDFNNIDLETLDESNRPVIPAVPQPGSSSSNETGGNRQSRQDPAGPEVAPGASLTAPLQADSANKTVAFNTPEEFVTALLPHAEKAARELGVEPRVLLAQAALETGWGKHMIRNEKGEASYNLFGIKADQRWQGEVADTMTHEYFDGQRMSVRDSFRFYTDPGQSFDDYVDFLTSHSRYQPALEQADDPQAYTQALQSAGYATDPRYADKILRIANSDVMRLAMNNDAADDQNRLG